MRNAILFAVTALLIVTAIAPSTIDGPGSRAHAQQADEPKMPEVIRLGKDAKLGFVTFNHVKHNGGAYNITPGTPIACISCHHTAQPADEIVKHPPLKTAWPADRTTSLTAELFAKDAKGAGVATCRDCHARTGQKPTHLPANPEIKHEASTALISLNNMNAFHRNCVGCHIEARKSNPASKGPVQTQCTTCHKKT
ncbi:MAG: cytochrome c3 family protein [Pyrinomonadaceae bacterium]